MSDDENTKDVTGRDIGISTTAPTRPAVRAHTGGNPPVPKPRTSEPSLGEVMGGIKTISEGLFRLSEKVDEEATKNDTDRRLTNEAIRVLNHEVAQIKAGAVPRALSGVRPRLQSFSDIEDTEAVSGSVLREAMKKQKSDQEALERRQSMELEAQTLKLKAEASSMIWKPVLATISTIALALIGQYFAARNTITADVKESTKEAVREEAKTVAKEAAKAVEESVQNAPKGTP